ncbi:MAG TPA: hypothetical protein VGC84_10025 [Ilumatobacteraceae bacterium]|jgi:hypothetical protein
MITNVQSSDGALIATVDVVFDRSAGNDADEQAEVTAWLAAHGHDVPSRVTISAGAVALYDSGASAVAVRTPGPLTPALDTALATLRDAA